MSEKDKESADELLDELESIKTLLNEDSQPGQETARQQAPEKKADSKPAQPVKAEPDIPTLLPVDESPDLADVVLSGKDLETNEQNDSMKRAIAELESLELGKGAKKEESKKPEAAKAPADIPTLAPEKPGATADNIPTIPTIPASGTAEKAAAPEPANPALKRKIKEIPLHELIKPDDLVEAIIQEYLPKMEAELRKELQLIMRDIQKDSNN